MSETTQLNEQLPIAPTYSSADAYPLDPYPSEDSDSTSATRNDSSSSMTAISRCLATQHPCPQLTEEAGEAKVCTRPGCPETIQECYNLRRGDAGTVDRSDIGRRFQAEYEHVPVLARPA